MQVLLRVRQILDGQSHKEMEPLHTTIIRCCSKDGELGETGAAAPVLDSDAAIKAADGPFQILVTGHSLGGAQAQLCTLDIARALPQWGYGLAQSAFAAHDSETAARCAAAAAAHEHHVPVIEREVALLCYTLGCPRVGNAAFARELKAACHNTWNVINDQDVGELCAFESSELRVILVTRHAS